MKKESYTSPRKVLSQEEYKNYKAQQEEFNRRKYQNKIKVLSKQNQYESNKERYNKTTSGRLGNAISKGLSNRSVTRNLYHNQAPVRLTSHGVRSGRKGRPNGTVKYVNPETGQPIGVYEYRKILTSQLRERRLNAQNNPSPQQSRIIRMIDQREQLRRQNPEGNIIPDTNGSVNINNIFREIDYASKIVG